MECYVRSSAGYLVYLHCQGKLSSLKIQQYTAATFNCVLCLHVWIGHLKYLSGYIINMFGQGSWFVKCFLYPWLINNAQL